jgi:hypothetical protein
VILRAAVLEPPPASATVELAKVVSDAVAGRIFADSSEVPHPHRDTGLAEFQQASYEDEVAGSTAHHVLALVGLRTPPPTPTFTTPHPKAPARPDLSCWCPRSAFGSFCASRWYLLA